MSSNYTFTQMFNEILKLAQPPKGESSAKVGVLAIDTPEYTKQHNADLLTIREAVVKHGAEVCSLEEDPLLLAGNTPATIGALLSVANRSDFMLVRDSLDKFSYLTLSLREMGRSKFIFTAPYPPDRKPLIFGTVQNENGRDVPVLGLPYSPKSDAGKALFESFAIPAIRNLCGFPPVTTDDKFWPTLFIDATR